MLAGIKVLLLGGDARQLEIIQKLCTLNADVYVCGFEQKDNIHPAAIHCELNNELLSQVDALILPAVGTDEEGFIPCTFSTKTLKLTQAHITQLKQNCIILTGVARTYLKELCTNANIDLVELFERDDIAIYNSIPTAEGALMMAIQHTDITIHGANTMVLGFGRTGITMARVLKALGAEVYFGVRRSEHYARAYEYGFKPFYASHLIDHVNNIDLIFNTIPTMIIKTQIIEKLQKSTVIIDLATKPGGTDFAMAEKHNIKAILAPGLPGIVAPKTAGIILANCIVQLLLDKKA